MSDIFKSDKTLRMLEKSLDISARRHRLITNNLANMDTIGFKPKDLNFKKALEAAMENRTGNLFRTHPKHLDPHPRMALKGRIRESDAETQGRDPVNIDVEMTNLVENNIKYLSGVEMLLRKMGILRNAIAEGGR